MGFFFFIAKRGTTSPVLSYLPKAFSSVKNSPQDTATRWEQKSLAGLGSWARAGVQLRKQQAGPGRKDGAQPSGPQSGLVGRAVGEATGPGSQDTANKKRLSLQSQQGHSGTDWAQ